MEQKYMEKKVFMKYNKNNIFYVSKILGCHFLKQD